MERCNLFTRKLVQNIIFHKTMVMIELTHSERTGSCLK
ncbi:hypothetical protein PPRY_a2456 [Pseudoalteromonas prydzensis ACAM 620]|nr:hypothetical protein [Pseudoalteromonas prydzensis ACAM 620]